MVLVSVRSWKFAHQHGLDECLLHFLASITPQISETKDRCESHSTLKIRKSCLVQGFFFFHRKHHSNNSTSSPRNPQGSNRWESNRLLCGSILTVLSQDSIYSTNPHLLPPSNKAGQLAVSSQAANSSWRANRWRKAINPQHYVVKKKTNQSPEWAEWTGEENANCDC